LQIKTKIVSSLTADSKPVKQEVNGTVILPPFSIPCLHYNFGSILIWQFSLLGGITQTLDLEMIRRVVYHCATTVFPLAPSLIANFTIWRNGFH
jgi:hypothetical protein